MDEGSGRSGKQVKQGPAVSVSLSTHHSKETLQRRINGLDKTKIEKNQVCSY